jgi:hypothetical protein
MDAKEEKALVNIAPDTFDCFDHALECLADVLDGVEDVAKLVLSYATPCDGYSKKPHDENRLPVVAVTVASTVFWYKDVDPSVYCPAWTTFLIRPIPICGQPKCTLHEYGSFEIGLSSIPRGAFRFVGPRVHQMMYDVSFRGTMLFAPDVPPEWRPLPDAWVGDETWMCAFSFPLQTLLRVTSSLDPPNYATIEPLSGGEPEWRLVLFDEGEYLFPSLGCIKNECRSAWRDLEPHVS